MNGARFIGSLKPISREKLAAVQRREVLKAEARLRQKLANSNQSNHRRAAGIARTAEALDTAKTAEMAEIAGNARTAPETPRSEARETVETENVQKLNSEQGRNLGLLLAQLERERLLEDLDEEALELLEAAAWKLVRNELPGKKWRAVLKGLKARRELRHPPPKYERRRNPPVGW